MILPSTASALHPTVTEKHVKHSSKDDLPPDCQPVLLKDGKIITFEGKDCPPVSILTL